jgi:hypothetical protein
VRRLRPPTLSGFPGVSDAVVGSADRAVGAAGWSAGRAPGNGASTGQRNPGTTSSPDDSPPGRTRRPRPRGSSRWRRRRRRSSPLDAAISIPATFPWTRPSGPGPMMFGRTGPGPGRPGGDSPHERRSAVRLAPQMSAVVRRTTDRPTRGDAARCVRASGTAQSIVCQGSDVLCSCGSNQYACCPSNLCHVDSSTNLCMCGAGV